MISSTHALEHFHHKRHSLLK